MEGTVPQRGFSGTGARATRQACTLDREAAATLIGNRHHPPSDSAGGTTPWAPARGSDPMLAGKEWVVVPTKFGTA
eukprot:12914954-Prorocentrum_lima.AAC.1